MFQDSDEPSAEQLADIDINLLPAPGLANLVMPFLVTENHSFALKGQNDMCQKLFGKGTFPFPSFHQVGRCQLCKSQENTETVSVTRPGLPQTSHASLWKMSSTPWSHSARKPATPLSSSSWSSTWLSNSSLGGLPSPPRNFVTKWRQRKASRAPLFMWWVVDARVSHL